MTDAGLITTLYLVSMVFVLISILCGGLLIWFRKAVFNAIKLKKLIKQGYVICRLKRHDKTELEIVVVPDKETNGVRFPGVEGLYTIDNASVILKDRKYPVYEWKEGETAPLNHSSEFVYTDLKCPNCNKMVTAKFGRPKASDPSVLDNLIQKILTLVNSGAINKWLIICFIGIVVLAGIGVVNFFMIDDFKKRAVEIIAPGVADACRASINATAAIITRT